MSLALCALSVVAFAAADGGSEAPFIQQVLQSFDEMAQGDLWHRFKPRDVPLAIYDGQRTWLLRHPKAPAGFAPTSELPGAAVMKGRHASIRANTSAELDGVLTATADLEHANRRFPRNAAALLIHEAFHVFQAKAHPDWTANEAVVFAYPIDDVQLLALRRKETAALLGALGASAARDGEGFMRTALALRAERFKRMAAPLVAYERGTELHEGLATYVEHRALADDAPFLVDVSPDEFRRRAYLSGRAFAVWLDRQNPTWRAELDRARQLTSLDELAAKLLERSRSPAVPPRPEQEKEIERQAAADVDALKHRQRTLRDDFLKSAGWTVIVDASKANLWPNQFDPLNARRVSEHEVLHSRWLKLSNVEARLEVLGRAVLTEGGGKDPLFDGVQRLTLAGLAEPTITEADGVIDVKGDQFTAGFSNSSLKHDGRRIVITLGAPTP